MDPHQVFCPNADCIARGHIGKGNIRVHSHTEQRYRCTLCRKTFSARAGTVFYRRHTPAWLLTVVVALVAHGCPVAAIEAVFGLQARTVRAWVATAGTHAQTVHEHLVHQPRDLVQVQADEIRVKTQGRVVWMALALMVGTRLWLGGVVGEQRDRPLIDKLARQIRACAADGPVLVAVDGLVTYVGALERAFRQAVPTGQRGRPRLVLGDELVIGQVIKQYARRRVVGVGHWIARGTAAAAAALGKASGGGQVLNTAYIERLNATFRERLASLRRRGRSLARTTASLRAEMYLVGTVYNFCSPHASLRQATGQEQTPAMAAGITDHCWTLTELLEHRVPPARWQPPKQRGRRSAAQKRLIEQWAA
jgi:transposase-like protein